MDGAEREGNNVGWVLGPGVVGAKVGAKVLRQRASVSSEPSAQSSSKSHRNILEMHSPLLHIKPSHVGARVGRLEVGNSEGRFDGLPETGLNVGTSDGNWVGTSLGGNVGFLDGPTVGELVGK